MICDPEGIVQPDAGVSGWHLFTQTQIDMEEKKERPGRSNNGNDPKRRSTLVTESNPEGAQTQKSKKEANGPKGKLVDGESTNDGR